MPAAARVGDKHRCRLTDPAPHVGGEIISPGCATVLIGEQFAARVGDAAQCEGGAFDVIVTGEPTVPIGGRPAARLGDATDGGYIRTGCVTVQVGPHPMVAAMKRASRRGVPLVEKYVRVKVAGPCDDRPKR